MKLLGFGGVRLLSESQNIKVQMTVRIVSAQDRAYCYGHTELTRI